jgi:amino acid adenylation domain-containing protein
VVRYLSDGNIEFLGRQDTQVKVRGYRIELGEIEAVLLSHAGIREAVVVVREETAGDKRLVGYLVSEGEGITVGELRSYLKERIPEYMIPAAFVMLEALPLTANGKVDRRALPAAEASRVEMAEAFVAPRTPVEEMVAGMWSEVLGVERVGVHDNFFELGGHSLLATQLTSRIRETFQVELPLRFLFEGPTVAQLAGNIETAQQRQEGLEAPPITPASREQLIPLSFAQQRLWFIDQLEPGNTVYNVPVAVSLKGSVNVTAFQQSLDELIRRHESLRTRFATVNGQPVQVIEAGAAINLSVLDYSELNEDEQQQQVRQHTAHETATAFDLSHGPLLRAKLLRLSADEHVLLMTMHHIVSDGWSMGILIREVAALYEAFSRGEASPLPELAIQYADFAVWQREWLEGEVLEKQLGYWREQLGGAPPVLELPTDKGRPAVQSFKGAVHGFELGEELRRGLEALSRREGATLFMTLLAAFQSLLHRYTNQDDIVVGADVANRNRAETEGLIGFFVNMLVLRTDLSGDPSFRELIGRVRETALGAYAHQDVPFEKLVEELQPERDMSRSPLFQVVFVLQNAPMPNLELPGLTLSPVDVDSSTTHFDITLTMEETEHGLSAWIEYNTDLFEETTIRRMQQHLETLLRAVIVNPEQRVSQIPLLGVTERRQLLHDYNQTATDFPRHSSIHQLFEQHASDTPDAVALIFNEQSLSYRELNERANQLAHHLRKLGVEVETPVAVCVERSIELIVGLLAILKAGGVYVPLDPAYPLERLSLMLDEVQPPVLLTQEHLADELPATWAHVLSLDTDWEMIEQESTANVDLRSDSRQLAYIIYTSGSTGRPKGVGVSHRNVVRLVRNTTYAEFSSTETFLQLAPISFDASTFEVWGSLLNGARLVVMPPEQPSLEELADVIRRSGVTTLWLTAGLFHQIVDTHLSALSGLHQLLAGGDVLSVRHVERVLRALPQVRLINGYGPTETTTFACCHVMGAGAAGGAAEVGATVAIGRPIANTEVYVLSEDLQPLPVGVAGEFYIGGEGLARGYLNRPELTAERFIPNPFSTELGARLYRTGDVVRYLSDGNIEFLGRQDTQVKVRGYRIELGEIEAVLLAHASVREAVVVAREEAAGDKRLVGYLVSEEESITGNELRSYLKERIPEYMIPAVFVMLEAMPLTANGKVDRRALPAPEASRAELESDFVAARTPVEEMVAGMWSEVLGVERVGVHDNFFELGGHSLLATQVVTRVRETFEVELPLRLLFESPTIGELAECIQSARLNHEGLQAPPVLPVGRERELPLSFSQQRLWFIDQLEPGNNAFNVPIAIRLSGRVDSDALAQSLNEIVRRHEVLRTSFTTIEGKLGQVIDPEHVLQLPVLDYSGLNEEERQEQVRQHAAHETATAFDLSHGPLLRAKLLRLSEDEHVLLMTMHHIVSDGWSMGILIREVAALYEAFSRGEASPLPELAIQYADFAVWQREWLEGEVLERQLGYWREQLGGAPPVLELPTDKGRPAVQSFKGAVHGFELGEELRRGLEALSRREGATLFMTLLAAFQTLLGRYSGQTDIVVGSPVANRNRAETEGLIGFFVNMLVMRTDLSGDPSFRELIGRVRETALGAYAHQDVPFEKLVEELQPERDMSRSPLFQIEFVLQNAPVSELRLSGLTLNPVEVEIQTTHHDLSLLMEETEHGLNGWVRYNTDLFEEATIRCLEEHFTTLLAGAVADPERRVAGIPLLTAAEEQQRLYEWNSTQSEYPQSLCIQQLFEEQVERTPGAVAVAFEGEQVTYRELNAKANQLASYLLGLGVGRGQRVGVLMENSIEMVVGILGAVKAGAAYVPLEPAYPAGRIAFIIEDAKLALLLSQRKLNVGLPQETRVVCLDADWKLIASHDEQNPRAGTTADETVYIIYTSGSTGQPKGVKIRHSSLTNYICWAKDVYLQREPLDFPLYSSLAFDLTVTSIFTPLISGGRLVVYPSQSQSEALDRILTEHQVDVLKLTPSHLSLIKERDNRDSRISRLIVGGEALETELARAVFESFGREVEIYNEYGPTEATVGCMLYRFAAERETRTHVPVGRPAANTQIYVLDERMELAAENVSGELYIGGAGIAEGYLNRAELTAERFVPHPYSKEEGARLYRTGDVARYLGSGEVEFIGRRDEQVKVRGYRIELGEIEAALRGHEWVGDVVVVVREQDEDDKRLVAYVAGESEQSPSAGELRNFLKGRLPEYMIPSAFVMLDRLPLTPNGKVDRRALPAPTSLRAEVAEMFVAPRTTVEELLASVWSDVLGVEQVGVHDNFFELGGHSLLATQVLTRLREGMQVELPLRLFFESPTVAGLAKAFTRAQQESRQITLPPIARVSREGRLPLSFTQQRLWLLNQLTQRSSLYNVPVAVRLEGQLDIAALEYSLSEIVSRHEVLRTTFSTSAGQPVQIINAAEQVRLEVTDLTGLPESERELEVRRIADEEAEQPFDLSRGPLWRARLLREAEDNHLALFTMHHIVSDAWSTGVLVREVAALYAAFSRGQSSTLPELPIQYADFASWQRQWLQGETLEAQLGYWREHLSGAPHVLELPTDKPRPPVLSFHGDSQPVHISREVSAALKSLSRREGVTLYMTLLAAFQTLLHRYSGQDEIMVGSPIANRTRAATEDLIGCFINTLVMRGDLSENPTFRALLARVRETTLEAYAHQDLPFEMLVGALQPERKANYTPLFQVWFVLQNAPIEPLPLPGLTLSPYGFGLKSAQFDLTLSLVETDAGIEGILAYNTDLFEAETVAAINENYTALLAHVSANPEWRLLDIPLGGEEQADRARSPKGLEGADEAEDQFVL